MNGREYKTHTRAMAISDDTIYQNGVIPLHLLIAWSNFRDLQMFLKKEMLFIIALVLLAFGYASTGSKANDKLTTTPAISSNENNDNANPSPDFDGDGTVGISDFLLFVDVFGSRQGDEGYDARYDLDGNGTIGISDFLIFVENFGKEVVLDDRAVLVKLYEATNGPNWTNKENWLSTAPLGDWHGVATDTNGRVVYLSLWDNNLRGPIPVQLAQLTKLTSLELGGNQLTGTIPTELAQLTKLTSLELGENQLTGTIPTELAQLTNLKELNLSTNHQLSGNIPSELGQLKNLKTLNLNFNGALSGTLPNALTGLTLETLLLHETLLCSPQGPGFQTWLRAIPFSRVPNCARSDEAAAYLVQATQSLEYPVPLVAGEAALLRVFVTAEQEVNATMPPVRATFYRDGVEVHTANIGGQTTNIPYQVNEASLLNSANAVVPGSVVMPGLEVVVEIDPDQTLDTALGIATRLPQTGGTALNVRSVPPFELTLIPFLWEENPDRSVLTQTEGLSSESDLFRLTRDILPVNEFRLTVHEPVLTSVDPTSDASGKLGSETALIYAMEGAKGYYMAIFRSVGHSGLLGIAVIPGFISQSILDGNTIAHELGHNLDLLHAPGCGTGGPDPEYPYEDGAIGAWGYDFVNKSLVSPATSDLMTYCDPRWISDYSFTKALAHRSQVESPPLAASYTPPTKGLLIWGGLDEDEKPFLEPAFVVSAPPSLPRIDGPYTLTGEDEHGNDLFSLPFGMPEYGCGGKGGAFAFILPVRDDWAGRLARIALSGPEGVSILDGEGGLSATLLLETAPREMSGASCGAHRRLRSGLQPAFCHRNRDWRS